MKKILFVSLIIMLIATVSACGEDKANKDKDDTSTKVEAVKASKKESIEVDKGLLNVEIKLPASMFEGQDIDSVIAEAKKDGVDEVTKNDDGSLNYKMSKSKHKEIMKEMKDSVLEFIEKTKTSEDFASIKDVTYNKDFSEFTMVVDKAKFENSFDGFAAMGFGLQGMYYQLFNGANPDDYKVTIIIKDEASGEVLDTVVYPDDLNK